MQLGTRWTAGGDPPARLSAEVVAAIREVDARVAGASPAPRWTLTWLEGRPVAELDDGVTVTIVTTDAAGVPVVRIED
ncbi:Fe-S osidoreductase [Microbacterium mangrovi]|uniref:Fe-S osidoreductase n=1 Tax=Microbacterium mangrovi TaxID=1348253 RepID=A0A0B2A491_9MICO|nr:hypothetical protein [Microbacterium mangrovi]KHK98259.1 Fe-S osidoreductase [Microbacterium mangrovi]